MLDTIASVGRLHPARPGERASAGPTEAIAPSLPEQLEVYLAGRQVKPMTRGQRTYMQAIFQSDLTLCTGPAGTGKTYLAVAAAYDRSQGAG